MHIFAIKVAARTETLFWIKEQEELYRREKRKRRIVKPRRRARRAIHAMRVPTRSRATSSCLAIGFLSFAQGTTSSPSRRLPTCTYIYIDATTALASEKGLRTLCIEERLVFLERIRMSLSRVHFAGYWNKNVRSVSEMQCALCCARRNDTCRLCLLPGRQT